MLPASGWKWKPSALVPEGSDSTVGEGGGKVSPVNDFQFMSNPLNGSVSKYKLLIQGFMCLIMYI